MQLTIDGITVNIEKTNESDFISLTDIAKQTERRAGEVIRDWLRNSSTLLFLEAWENMHNPDFKGGYMPTFRLEAQEKRKEVTPQRYINATNAMGLVSKSGRYGGTYAHRDIALHFCYWLEPRFQLFMIKLFQKLIKQEYEHQNLEWHVSMITDRIDEVRNLLDTIPGQKAERNRFKG